MDGTLTAPVLKLCQTSETISEAPSSHCLRARKAMQPEPSALDGILTALIFRRPSAFWNYFRGILNCLFKGLKDLAASYIFVCNV